jgi:hypothetical protein
VGEVHVTVGLATRTPQTLSCKGRKYHYRRSTQKRREIWASLLTSECYESSTIIRDYLGHGLSIIYSSLRPNGCLLNDGVIPAAWPTKARFGSGSFELDRSHHHSSSGYEGSSIIRNQLGQGLEHK